MEAVTPTVEFHAMDTMEKMKMINFSGTMKYPDAKPAAEGGDHGDDDE